MQLTTPHSFRETALWSTAFLLIAVLGVFLRIHSYEPVKGVGFDEQLYCAYVDQISQNGVGRYPGMVDLYVRGQTAYPIAMLPPTRVTFILASRTWQSLFGGPTVESIRAVSCAASILVLLLSCVFAWRTEGRAFALAVLALMAVAPTQIYMAHRALIDGFFNFITLLVIWSLWEVLQNSRNQRSWLALYGISLTLLILTKENAAFVYAAILGLLFANRWLHFGRIFNPLLLMTLVAPMIGVILLAWSAGGFKTLATVYSLNISKSVITPYAIHTGDGPWFRYLSDLLLVSPSVFVFAIGGAFSLNPAKKAGWYFLAFIFFSYLCMCNVTYGMNLRYANIWDFPLRFLALLPLFLWAGFIRSGRRRTLFLIAGVALLGCFELDNYLRIFVDHPVYDPIPANLLQALDILKF